MRTLCGISLNRFGVYIGSIYLLQSIIGSISLILNLVNYTKSKNRANADGTPFDEDKEIVSMLSTAVLLCLTFVLTSPLLIWGSVKKKHLLLIPWLYNSLVCIIVNGLYLISMLLKLFVNPPQNSDIESEVGAFQFIILFIAFAFQIVLYQIIRIFYKDLIFDQQLTSMETSSTIYIVFDEPTDQG